MSTLWRKISEVVIQVAAKGISGPSFLTNAVKIAMFSLSHTLAQMCHRGEFVEDLRRLKENGLHRSEARADTEAAKAKEAVANATEAENRANLLTRNDRISRAEEKQKLAEAAKTNAEAAALLKKAEVEAMGTKIDAVAKFVCALSKLKQKGGRFAVDPVELAKLFGGVDVDLIEGSSPKLPPLGDDELDAAALCGILEAHAKLITNEANQIYREYNGPDYGIDAEIEFKNDKGKASGKRVYLQLKSGDSHLTKRKTDGREIFHIKKTHHAEYWQSQAYPVYLVICTSDKRIRWMNISEYLKANTKAGKFPTQILFSGEPFTAADLRRLRADILTKSRNT